MSKQFNFRLATVQQLRVANERRAQEMLAATLSARDAEAKMADSARQLASDADAAARRTANDASSTQQLMAAQYWRERVQRHRTDAERQLEQAQSEVELSRRHLVDAHRGRREIDMLHDAALVEHKRQVERAETAHLDELSQQIFLAKRKRAA